LGHPNIQSGKAARHPRHPAEDLCGHTPRHQKPKSEDQNLKYRQDANLERR